MSTVSSGILFINDSKLLIGHVTGQAHWDIPKGKIEDNETPIEAAIRETYEEAGIVVFPYELKDLGMVPYRQGKQLHLFAYIGTPPSTDTCIDSLKHSKSRIELDDFKYAEFGELHLFLNQRMIRALGRVLFNNILGIS